MQVLPIVWAGPVNASSSGRQLATPMPWPVPNLQHVQPGPQVSMQNWVLDAVFDPVTVIEGGRRRLTGAWPRGGAASLGRRLLQGPAVNNVPTLPPGLQGAVFRPRPGFSSASLSLRNGTSLFHNSPCGHRLSRRHALSCGRAKCSQINILKME